MAPAVERVVVINDDSVESGGAASIALSSVRELRRQNVAVTLLTGDSGSNPDLAPLGVDIVSLEGQHILEGSRAGAALRGLYCHKTLERLAAWINAHDTPRTVYHLHNWHKVLSPSVFVALRKVAPRLVISTHDYFLACPNGAYFHFPRGEICGRTPLSAACLLAQCDKRNYGHKLWRMARGAIRHYACNLHGTAATVLAVHEGMRPLLERADIDGSSIRVLRNPVTPWRNSRVSAERNHSFLFVGRFEQDKGARLLARAARRVGATLRMIGKGPLVAEVRRDFPEVELTGWKPRHEIAELCRQARALVMPSKSRETFGLVALEAAMSGIPVVVSDSALISEDLVQIGVGAEFQSNHVEALAQTLATLMKDDIAVAAMSRSGFEKARTLAPTPEAWCEELLSIYSGKLSAASQATSTPPVDLTRVEARGSGPLPHTIPSRSAQTD